MEQCARSRSARCADRASRNAKRLIALTLFALDCGLWLKDSSSHDTWFVSSSKRGQVNSANRRHRSFWQSRNCWWPLGLLRNDPTNQEAWAFLQDAEITKGTPLCDVVKRGFGWHLRPNKWHKSTRIPFCRSIL